MPLPINLVNQGQRIYFRMPWTQNSINIRGKKVKIMNPLRLPSGMRLSLKLVFQEMKATTFMAFLLLKIGAKKNQLTSLSENLSRMCQLRQVLTTLV